MGGQQLYLGDERECKPLGKNILNVVLHYDLGYIHRHMVAQRLWQPDIVSSDSNVHYS